MSDSACWKCGASGERIVLGKCPICLKMVCEPCRVSRSGRQFCSTHCADEFFFADDEDE